MEPKQFNPIQLSELGIDITYWTDETRDPLGDRYAPDHPAKAAPTMLEWRIVVIVRLDQHTSASTSTTTSYPRFAMVDSKRAGDCFFFQAGTPCGTARRTGAEKVDGNQLQSAHISSHSIITWSVPIRLPPTSLGKPAANWHLMSPFSLYEYHM